MSSDDAAVTVDLGATRSQFAAAFVWVALGLAVGLGFVLLSTTGGDVTTGSVAIGVAVTALAVVSGVLEHRGLPGAVITMDATRLVVQPRRGAATVVPTKAVAALRIDLVKPQRRGSRFQASDGPGEPRQPGWWLVIEPAAGAPAPPGLNRAFPVGVDDARVRALGAACQSAGIALTSGA